MLVHKPGACQRMFSVLSDHVLGNIFQMGLNSVYDPKYFEQIWPPTLIRASNGLFTVYDGMKIAKSHLSLVSCLQCKSSKLLEPQYLKV